MQQHALRSFCHSTRVPKGMQRETPRKIEARERQRNGKLKKGEDCWWNTCSTAYLPPPFLSWTMMNKQTNKTATKQQQQQHGNGERLLLPLSVTSITFSNNSNKATKKTSRTKARSTHNYLKRNGNFFSAESCDFQNESTWSKPDWSSIEVFTCKFSTISLEQQPRKRQY